VVGSIAAVSAEFGLSSADATEVWLAAAGLASEPPDSRQQLLAELAARDAARPRSAVQPRAPDRDELARAVAATAERWRSTPAEVEVERAFADALERWIADLLPPEPPWLGRWFDGLGIDQHRFEEAGRLEVAGHLWHLDTQRPHPFEATLVPGVDGLQSFEVRFGEPEIGWRRRPSNEWLFRFRGL